MRPVIGLTHSIQSDEKRLMMPLSCRCRSSIRSEELCYR